MTHPAATHPPKYSTNDDEAGSVEAAGTRISVPGSTVKVAASPLRLAVSDVTRISDAVVPGFATYRSVCHSGPPPWGQNHAPLVATTSAGPGLARRLRTIQGDAGRHDRDHREGREAQAPPGPHRDDPGLRVIHSATAQSRASTQTERVRTH